MDVEACEVARRLDTYEGWNAYTAAHPDGACAAEAQAARQRLPAPAPLTVDVRIVPHDGSGAGLVGIRMDLPAPPRAPEPAIGVSWEIERFEGKWDRTLAWLSLDVKRPALVSCWEGLGVPKVELVLRATFTAADGKISVQSVESIDGAPHDDVAACVRQSLDGQVYPKQLEGTYTYRVRLY